MGWMKLKFAPGVVKDLTRYSANGRWTDSNLIRFHQGYPEKWRGWQKANSDFEMEGMCRSIYRFADLSGFEWTGVGTSRRFYVMSDDLYYDVSPLRASTTLAEDPLDATDTETVVVVNHTSHGAFTGDVVILSGATTFAGITADALNGEHVITYIDDNSYSIDVGEAATSTASGGDTAVVAGYIFHAGSDDQIYGGGYGTLGYGDEEYGGDPAEGIGEQMGIWSQSNWGEDLIACAQKGPIFYWDATDPDGRMVDILDLASADTNAPEYAEFILVSHRDRHLLAFGGTAYSSGDPAPTTVRWCDQEDILNWNEADTAGTAGSLPFSIGSRFISAVQTSNEILVWTDAALYSLRYLGAPLIYGIELIETKSDIVGLKACDTFANIVFWMGRSGFYSYSGRVDRLDCPVWDYIFQNINWQQATKVFCATNKKTGEILWFYPSVGSLEIDSYVSFNPLENVWAVGSLPRTAWLDLDTLNEPIAASTDGYIYVHEIGADDGSTEPPSAINAYIESAPLELSSEGSFDKGDKFMFIRRVIPDVTFRSYTDSTPNPEMNIDLKMMDYPGGGVDSTSSSQVIRSATIPVEEHTEVAHVRLRGRALVLRAESDTTGTLWRLGDTRIDVRTDGQR